MQTNFVFSKPKYKVDDVFRVSTLSRIFENFYTANWSTESFTNIKVLNYDVPTYKLKYINGEEIKCSFYEHKIMKTNYHNEYLVEKVLKTKGKKMYVKWLGFDNPHNSWINKTDVCAAESTLADILQDDTNLKHIYNDFVGGDMIHEKEICSKWWDEDMCPPPTIAYWVHSPDIRTGGGGGIVPDNAASRFFFPRGSPVSSQQKLTCTVAPLLYCAGRRVTALARPDSARAYLLTMSYRCFRGGLQLAAQIHCLVFQSQNRTRNDTRPCRYSNHVTAGRTGDNECDRWLRVRLKLHTFKYELSGTYLTDALKRLEAAILQSAVGQHA
ncbi:hypothetical protein PR048_027379, partial [Dryococelus australis]